MNIDIASVSAPHTLMKPIFNIFEGEGYDARSDTHYRQGTTRTFIYAISLSSAVLLRLQHGRPRNDVSELVEIR